MKSHILIFKSAKVAINQETWLCRTPDQMRVPNIPLRSPQKGREAFYCVFQCAIS